MGQEYLPGRLGTASGVTLGLSIGLGGVGAPLLGLVADQWGLNTTLYVLAALPLGGLALTFTLPPARSRRSAVGSRPPWRKSPQQPGRSKTATSASR
jgi:FSR family fosmidomycin resistance protein-like MFS transporter